MKTTNVRFILMVVLLLGVLSGCGGMGPLPAVGPPVDDAAWQKSLTGPDSLRRTLSQGTVEYISGAEAKQAVPVRLFGAGGTKPPVLFTHGLQSHSGWFAQSAAHIAGLGHPVYALDRKGSGLSSAVRGDVKNFREWMDEIDQVAQVAMQRHGADRFYLVGHCFGAIPATAYAATNPDRLLGLILTSPALYTKTSLSSRQILKIFLSRPQERGFVIPVPLDVESFSELVAYQSFIALDRLSLKAATGDFYLQVHRARKYIEGHVQHLRMPLLMILAGDDPICDNIRNTQFFLQIPAREKTLTELGDARHILEFSAEKELFFDTLSRWLAHRQ